MMGQNIFFLIDRKAYFKTRIIKTVWNWYREKPAQTTERRRELVTSCVYIL
jgi:hypothetical protein